MLVQPYVEDNRCCPYYYAIEDKQTAKEAKYLYLSVRAIN